MPEATRKIFVAAFSRLPQRVLWKWEDESGMSDLPPNVRLYTWLPPLIDLLAHPKMRLLMTHGGLYSNQETVWSGVPLIGFPVFGDQTNYVVKAQRDGYALKLDWMTLTEDILFDSIQEIINNPKYIRPKRRNNSLFRQMSGSDSFIHSLKVQGERAETVEFDAGANRDGPSAGAGRSRHRARRPPPRRTPPAPVFVQAQHAPARVDGRDVTPGPHRRRPGLPGRLLPETHHLQILQVGQSRSTRQDQNPVNSIRQRIDVESKEKRKNFVVILFRYKNNRK